jgi:hypothetical protein
MSKQNIYYELSDKVVKRYAKVPVHLVAGVRIDPYDTKNTISWLLMTDASNYDEKTKQRTFVYEDEVIELYSQYEADAFVRLNKKLIERGLLKVYTGSGNSVDETNTMSDDELSQILSIRSNEDFASEVNKLSSSLTLIRLKQLAIDLGKSVKRVQVLEARIKQLNDNN